MRQITHLVVHCSGTQPDATVSAIIKYWREVLGWKNSGYHHIIDFNGNIIQLLPEHRIANGVKGHNANSVHICYIGGVDEDGKPKDTRSRSQKSALLSKLSQLRRAYPSAVIQGHRDFPGVVKACPSFDARTEYAGL